MTIDFRHNQSAHCENGVTSNLLGHQGVDISEAMAFGIGSGLFFTYMPFLKYNGIPISSFRPIPGIIFKRTAKRLGIRIFSKKFRDPEKSMQALDDALQKGLPVGLQVGVFHLPYFPAPYRFHFNAHNLVVYGRENGVYQVSDPVMETPESLTRAELMRVRWAHGVFQPKGRMYYPLQIPPTMDIRSAIVKGIRKNCTDMLSVPVPYIGIRGIRYLSKKNPGLARQTGRKEGLPLSGADRPDPGGNRNGRRRVPLHLCRIPPGSLEGSRRAPPPGSFAEDDRRWGPLAGLCRHRRQNHQTPEQTG